MVHFQNDCENPSKTNLSRTSALDFGGGGISNHQHFDPGIEPHLLEAPSHTQPVHTHSAFNTSALTLDRSDFSNVQHLAPSPISQKCTVTLDSRRKCIGRVGAST